MTYSQGQELIYQLNNTLAILRSWSNENKTKSDKLETYIKHDNVREQDNYEYQHKETWAKVKDLNQNSLMLLEASYAFAKKTESAAEFSKNSIRTDAWEKCIRAKNCTFKKLNEMMDEESLELSDFTKKSASDTQKALIESIDKLNEMCGESQEAKGLNSSIDTLSKVNSTQVTAISSLSGQVSNLARITAHNYQMQKQNEELKQKSDELYYADTGTVQSPHLDTSLKNYE
ncbi:MAG: hypothetical protein IJ254_02915 [Succinivibrio sp.]|nr:hypothetical protein [Succinivibrio sp.]